MAATITTSFYNTESHTYEAPAKIVFTSPNINDHSPAGTRSHVLPDLMDIALWYEDTSKMHRVSINQDKPDSIIFGFYGELHSSYIFDSGSNMTLYDQTGQSSDWPTSSTVYYNNNNSMSYSSRTWNSFYIQLTHSSHTGTDTASSGTKIFLDPSLADVNFQNSIIYEIILGEAYNVSLTAWDDDTHTTTNNTIISGSHYRATCVACYITGTKDSPYPAGGSTYGTLIGEPGYDVVLYGDVSKYTLSGTMKYNAIDSDVSGAYFIFKPRLYNITSAIPYGNYDFITTLHFQYT